MGTDRWAVVDVETTGLDPNTCRVVSIAALALSPDGRVVHRMNRLVNPGVDPGPTHVHGLTAEMLCGAAPFDAVASELATVLRGRTLVAHNAGFDYAFLASEARRASVELPINQTLCTVELAAQLDLGVSNLKLATLASHFSIAQQRPHDALDDATVLARIFPRLQTLASQTGVRLPVRQAHAGGVRYSSTEVARRKSVTTRLWCGNSNHPSSEGTFLIPTPATRLLHRWIEA